MNYVAKFKYFAIISIAVLIAGFVVGAVVGPNFGVDFTGGTLMTIDMGGEFDVNDVTAALKANGIADAPVVKSGTTSTLQDQAVIRFKPFTDEMAEVQTQQKLLEALKEKYPKSTQGGVERVGGVASQALIRNCLFSLAIAAVLMLGYIWIRFELLSGVAAVICLLQDVLIMLAMSLMLRVQINSPFIAAVLTIVGYSINNTIVIFDRVRENNKRYGDRKNSNRAEIINFSISESLTRSINTSLTTLITIGCVYLFGVQSIKEFALPIIIGLLAGTYSSIFLSAPLWNLLHSYADKKPVKAKVR